MKSVAIIPARGGSRRISRKNIREFCGRPMLSYPISLAKDCGVFDEVIVSSEDKEILQIALELGVKVIDRKKYLSFDSVPTIAVIRDAILELNLDRRDAVCCIYPATPLLEARYILEGLSLLKKEGMDYVFGALAFESSPYRGFYLKDGRVQPLFLGYENTTSCALDRTYHDAGAFYWGFAQSFLQEKSIFSSHSAVVELSILDAHDIDNMDDLLLAQLKYQFKHSKRRFFSEKE